MIKKSFLKIIFVFLIIGLSWWGTLGVDKAWASFVDTETSFANTFTAATLDFSLESADGFSPNVTPSQSSSRTINVVKDGILGFQYTLQTTSETGALCDYLNLTVTRDGIDIGYTGNLKDFIYNAGEFSAPDEWVFTANLTTSDPGLQGESCHFDLVFDGEQIGSSGFSDQETISNTVTAGTWGPGPSTQTIRLFPVADSYISSKGSEVNDNYGSSEEIKIKSKTGDNKRGIIRFDLSVLPDDSIITSCSLNLWMHDAPSSSRNYGAHRVTNYETDWTESGVTWNNYKTDSAWNSAGGDFNTSATAATTTGATKDVWLSWNLSTDCDALTKRSWIIKDSVEDATGTGYEGKFRTKDQIDTAKYPYLEINFTAPAVPTSYLVINEVYYDVGSGEGDEGTNEWVEIYNPTSSAINISGWKICDNSGCDTIPSSTPIPAYGFAVITPYTSTWGYWLTIPTEAIKIVLGSEIGSGSGSGLSNTGDQVILKDATDVIIDAISYGNDTTQLDPSIIDVDKGWSIARILKGYDTDKASDFWANPSPNPGANPHTIEAFISSEISNELPSQPYNTEDVLTPTPTPEQVSEPTVTAAPTTIPTPTPELTPTVKPTPTVESTSTPTEVPSTPTPTPEPTETPTTEPTITPTPIGEEEE